jgi:hypothetical protein
VTDSLHERRLASVGEWDNVRVAGEPLELHKEFIREMTLRLERGGREIVRAFESFGGELREEARLHRLELAEFREEMREELRDLREESRAQRNALLRLIDRLDNGGPAAAGT